MVKCHESSHAVNVVKLAFSTLYYKEIIVTVKTGPGAVSKWVGV